MTAAKKEAVGADGGSNSPRSQPLRFERLWKRQLLPDYSIHDDYILPSLPVSFRETGRHIIFRNYVRKIM